MPSNSRPTPTFRAAGVTATTLVALVAMSAIAAAGTPCYPPRALEVEARLEGHVVRAVAAAVVARVMRDLLVPDHSTAAVAVLEVCVQTVRTAVSCVAVSRDARGGGATLLGERLLDLPPPAC